MIKISIVIPVYKVKFGDNWKYFENLINTIVKNIYKLQGTQISICQIIIVNDEPNCIINLRDILFDSKYNNLLTIINNRYNMGQAKSRNIGFELCKGDLIHFIDQDDYIDDDFYFKLATEYSNSNADLVIANINLVRNGVIRNYYKNMFIYYINKFDNFWQMRFFLVGNYIYSPGQYLITAKCFREICGYPELISKGTDDYGLILNLTLQKRKYIFVNNTRFYYRLHDNQNKTKLNMTNSLIELFNNYRFSFYIILLKYFKLNKFLNLIKILIFRVFFFNSTRF